MVLTTPNIYCATQRQKTKYMGFDAFGLILVTYPRDRIQRMFRFIKMWLLLRILAFQEEYIMSQPDNDFVDQWKNGLTLYSEEKPFILEASKHSLFWSFLPKKLRGHVRPAVKGEKTPEAKKSKIRGFESLLKSAKEKGYLEIAPKNVPVTEVGTKAPRNVTGESIRVSHTGDHFITYFGGFEALIKAFPGTWGLLSLSILPWLVTNHTQIINFLHL